MKIAVCVKQSIDTEALITLGSDGEVSTEGAALIIDPYAEFKTYQTTYATKITNVFSALKITLV